MGRVKRILAVDDDDKNLLIIKDYLEEEQFLVFTAKNGKYAYNLLQSSEHEFDAILLDWMMPEMDGITLLKKIKQEKRFKNIPVIMQTARSSHENITEGINAGSYYYLTKPFSLTVLSSVLRAATQEYRQLTDLERSYSETMQAFQYLQDATFRFKAVEEGIVVGMTLAKFWPEIPEEVYGMMELVINAIEHGNLEISYDEKSKLIAKHEFEKEISKRLHDPRYRDRWVDLSAHREEDHFIITIKDQGKGFDFAKYTDFDARRFLDNHGRGIAMARYVHGCKIAYTPPGNIVTVTIPSTAAKAS